MYWLSILIVGLIVGALAKLFMPGSDPGGIIITMLLGLAGASLAGFIGHQIGWYKTYGQAPGLIASVLGAMLVLFIYRLIVGRAKL